MIENVPRPLVIAWVLLVGAVVGSFLNVVIARMPEGESVAYPASHCPRCGAFLAWYDNLPVISFLLLRARCRACRSPISIRYPLVEGLGACAALVAFGRHGLSMTALAEFGFAAALIALAFIDLDAWLLPNAITWPLIAIGLALGWFGLTPAGSVRWALYGAGLGFAAFGLLAWVGEKAFRKEVLGLGDVWLLAGLGSWMGAAPLLPIVLLASLQGSVVGVALIALGKSQPGPSPPPSPDVPSGPIRGSGENARASPGADAAAPDEDSATADGRAAPPRVRSEEDDWVPPRHAVPFGPFLVAGTLEWLWLGDLLARAFPVLRLFQ